MKLRFLMVPLIVAVVAAPLVVAAQQGTGDRAAKAVAVGPLTGNGERACARLAGRPPGRAECRGLIARGGALMPAQAYSISMPGYSGIVHYTAQPEGLRVVASLAEVEGGAPLRIVSSLAPDAVMVLSVPKGFGEAAAEVEMRRRGDLVVIRDVGSVPAPERATETTPDTTAAPATPPDPHGRPLAAHDMD